MKEILSIISNWLFPKIKKCKNYTVYRIDNNKPTVILSNFNNVDKIPKETEELIMVQCEHVKNINISNSSVLESCLFPECNEVLSVNIQGTKLKAIDMSNMNFDVKKQTI